ncbi:MAG: hypothetical protein LR015_03110 [Verrucomicrobia bacterium]|nr:hypothetical protein [Verrucomicrobiota bacterium]
MKNPFAPNLVPPPRELSIRRAEESVLKDRLKGPARILIEGPRRTGKTSLVRASVAESELLAIDWKNLTTPQEALVALNYQVEDFLKKSNPVRKLLSSLGERGFSLEAGLWGAASRQLSDQRTCSIQPKFPGLWGGFLPRWTKYLTSSG